MLVALGAASYGILTTFVKLAYSEGYNTYEVTFSQMLLGFICLVVINFFYKGYTKKKAPEKASKKNILHLMLAGTSLGLTSTFYYLAVQYVSVSIGIVLLMQSVWMGVVFNAFLTKEKPSFLKILAVIIILTGTVLATNILFDEITLSPIGILFGLLAALSYTVTIYTSNTVAKELPSITRSKWMMLGGLIVVTAISIPYLNENFNLLIFTKWGPILALFGTVLPPLLMTTGMPKINVGLGVIITSIELPVAVMAAYLLLNETVLIYQWLGIILILASIVVMNIRKLKQ
ncbi:DMT family transporter [Mesonia sp. JHPTF-M18]|uniref:DMT family transporter n=2 Tax=Mesonia aestuariivivens TaxID=2796128 RepID=A0ABS6VYC8_9FLAO|nr:DMT family transporter [Mesonia aestuariivivens]